MAKKKPTPAESPASGEAVRNYTVLARRYRPQQFSDLVGQEATAQALINAIKSNRVAHAYLFTGTRGIGKTTTARILAKCLNCVKGPTPNPCDQCENCLAIASGEDTDVLEIDGASNNKVEEIRELRQNVGIRPSHSRCKIYIIDEVHMLTTSAFNALLKTLEEPPAHVKFIFATTEIEKVPITIRSRCQRFDLLGIGQKRIGERLKEIVASEGLEADDEALDLLARRAGGSMRDAQSLLDQMLAFGGKKLTATLVHQLLGTAAEELVVDLATAALAGDATHSLPLLDKAVQQGVQVGELVDQLQEYWRDLMIVSATAGANKEGLHFSPRFHATQAEQVGQLALDTVMAGLDLIAATKARLRGSTHGRILLEMLIIRLGRLENLASLAEIARNLGKHPGTSRNPPAGSARTESYPPAGVKKNSIIDGEGESAPIPSTLRPVPLKKESVQDIWGQALARVGPMLRSNLEKVSSVAIFGPNSLVLSFSASYNKEAEFCQEPARARVVEEVLQKIVGNAVTVRFDVLRPVNGEPPAVEPRVPRMQQLREAATRDPLVKRAMEVLGAQVMEVDDGFAAARSTPMPAES